MADTEQGDAPLEPQARIVTYCGVCTLPPEVRAILRRASIDLKRERDKGKEREASILTDAKLQYCEYGGTVKKCQDWLQSNQKQMYDRIWSAGLSLSPKSHIRLPVKLLTSGTEALEAATASLSVEAQKRAAKDAQKKTAKAEAAEAKQADKLAKSVITIKRIERNKRKFVTAVIGLETFGLDLKKCAKDFGKKFATGSSVTKVASGGEEIVVQGDVSDELEEFILEKYKDIPEDNIEFVDDKKKKKAAAAAAERAS
ncbi:Density-regulated protein DRP1 [Akanthomyces lecanii RCEF 1005]|uniref:Translation machinery-associated protein 22 n=1 Tax=Akanthomyces lecanii RCEF 1005 TaxID=1081108 RepID=A0A168JM26_CORDF|nr:Density-regulated protein DRP1 [Akanthomyces lecanii RCEF 1005]